jgi:hypothetical protein
MGFFDKIKGAMNAVTGNAAKVTLDFEPKVAIPGDTVRITISATSTGQEVKSKGVFLDLRGEESVRLPKGTVENQSNEIQASKTALSQEFQIANAFVLAAGESKTFESTVQLPGSLQPSFQGALARLEWQLRGRVEAFGNDPDSGFQSIRIGTRN